MFFSFYIIFLIEIILDLHFVHHSSLIIFMTITDTNFVGKIWFHFQELASTNGYAAAYLTEKTQAGEFLSAEGAVFTTFNQTAGRGQRTNNWHSEADKNLAFTAILHPRFLLATEQFCMNTAIALAVYDTIAEVLEMHGKSGTVNDLKIKWPNDIFIGNKKVAGILIQNTLHGATIQASAIGIGINVNQKRFNQLPDAGSLINFIGDYIDLYDLVQKLSIHTEKRFLELKSGERTAQQELYKTLLYRMSTPALYRRVSDNFVFEGVIKNITASGCLVIEDKLGKQIFNLHEVKFLI